MGRVKSKVSPFLGIRFGWVQALFLGAAIGISVAVSFSGDTLEPDGPAMLEDAERYDSGPKSEGAKARVEDDSEAVDLIGGLNADL